MEYVWNYYGTCWIISVQNPGWVILYGILWDTGDCHNPIDGFNASHLPILPSGKRLQLAMESHHSFVDKSPINGLSMPDQGTLPLPFHFLFTSFFTWDQRDKNSSVYCFHLFSPSKARGSGIAAVVVVAPWRKCKNSIGYLLRRGRACCPATDKVGRRQDFIQLLNFVPFSIWKSYLAKNLVFTSPHKFKHQSLIEVFNNLYMGSARSIYLEIRLIYIEYHFIFPILDISVCIFSSGLHS